MRENGKIIDTAGNNGEGTVYKVVEILNTNNSFFNNYTIAMHCDFPCTPL